ncbi:MAG: hypothetical protein A2X42_02345 [Candidatus Margulisbacteria bacterium GWF2_38_17]|nr:MAG: hypothetical protein A2X43_09420 [Candidatus Margulisbacteria bacterium GWD2_39_127]OGI02891.1 MAG: hypothetical protein A2X42_02345 [Candidatus Margulisbacteria bacterium GWF2_38_17]OGI06813.1 MAG: hypothetical protein A2X41_03635 [Candidatus Margulisbacteria bacterium GWE2_39_32]
MGIIFYLSSRPGSSLHLPEFSNIDKLLHFAEYLGLSFLCYRALFADKRWQFKKISGAVIAFVALFAFFDELHQYFVPGRDASAADFSVDVLGVLVMSWFYKE